MILNAKQDNHILGLAMVTLLILREINHNVFVSHVSSGSKIKKFNSRKWMHIALQQNIFSMMKKFITKSSIFRH